MKSGRSPACRLRRDKLTWSNLGHKLSQPITKLPKRVSMGSKRVADPDPVHGSKSTLFTTKKTSGLGHRFWIDFGPILPPFWIHFGSPTRPFGHPDRSWTPTWFENVDLHEIIQKSIEKQEKRHAGGSPKRPKTAPRRSWRVTFCISKIVLFFVSVCVRFCSILAPQMLPFWHPFGEQNRSKNQSEIGLLKVSPQDRPETAQDLPRPPQEHPRSSHELSKTIQELSRSLRLHQAAIQKLQATLKSSQSSY